MTMSVRCMGLRAGYDGRQWDDGKWVSTMQCAPDSYAMISTGLGARDGCMCMSCGVRSCIARYAIGRNDDDG